MPPTKRFTAAEVKAALYGKHPSTGMNGGPGEWTCLEEFNGIDLLAWSAWSSSDYRRVGYEVKVSRSDYRREVLDPSKRASAVAFCDEFYFAVPAGLLKPEEIAWEESLWDDGDFKRVKCPAKCRKTTRYERGDRYMPRQGTVTNEKVPVPVVLPEPWRWERVTPEEKAQRFERDLLLLVQREGWTHRTCPECGGKGYVKGSRVEREAPTLWVPRDVGLVTVDGRGASIVRKAPRRHARPIHHGHEVANLVRWASFRPDPRHRTRLVASAA